MNGTVLVVYFFEVTSREDVMRHLVPFDRRRAVGRLLALLAGVSLLIGITAVRHPRSTLNPWRPGPANLIESPVGHQLSPPLDGALRQARSTPEPGRPEPAQVAGVPAP